MGSMGKGSEAMAAFVAQNARGLVDKVLVQTSSTGFEGFTLVR
jgi:hypothetical protein